LENSFKTEIHRFQVGSETHVSNVKEISVPEALGPVIAGVSMNDFFRKGHMGPVRQLKDVKSAEATQPRYTSSSTTHYVGPWDFATIYNTFPLLNKGVTGAGTSIAVVGRTDILLSDVQTYRQIFDLPENDPIFIHAGQDNGTEPGDDGEADLDVEISGGIAPNSQVYFVVGTPTFFVDGITNSIEYIVENNLADIMSISYGSCESVEGIGGNAYNNQAFEQAAAQGISVFVASGDNGPAECDSPGDSYENQGYATGAEASTPYNVSVGASQGFEGNTAAAEAPYWSSTSQQAPHWGLSALSYIPEVPWNEALGADTTDTPSNGLSGLYSGSGGISAYYLKPPWQRGSNVPTADPALFGGNWATGVTFTSAGSGYTSAPTVTFTGGGCVTEPVATTTISGGTVTSVVFTYFSANGSLRAGQGFGCTSAPTVTFGAAPSGGTTATGTATIGPMQNILPLISGVPHRYTPDLVLNGASDHDATLFCSEGNCQVINTNNVITLSNAGLVGGTSVAAPSMAGIQALIDQANGGRQGMPGYIYYALSAAQNATNCNSTLGNAIGSNCVFQDITQGNNLICGTSACQAATGRIGFQAGTGYDLASGLGSVNAANMATSWGTVSFHSTTTTVNLSKTSGIAQGTPVTISGTVMGTGGTPTGDVAILVTNGDEGQTIDISDDANAGGPNGPGAFVTLNNGTYTATVSNLPGGSYNVSTRYAGDGNFASSLSTPVPVTVAQGNSTITITPGSINQSTCSISTGSGITLTYGGLAFIPATVSGTTGQGVPTGTVIITVDGVTWGTETLDPNGNGYLVAGVLPTSSCLYDYIFSQGPLLSGGTHTIGATYSGDATFSPATATPVQVTVNRLSVTPTLAVGASYLASGASDQLTASFTIAALTGATAGISGPTGNVVFTDTTTGNVLGTVPVVNTIAFSGNTYSYSAAASFVTTGITSNGPHSITATYAGDINFASTVSSAATVTVGAGTATSVSVSSSANPTTLGGRPTFTATVTGGATSGTVTFFDGSVVLGTGTVGSASTTTLRLGTTPAFIGGTHNITASFSGVNSTYLASTSPVFVQTVTQGTAPIALAVKNAGTAGKNFTFAAVLSPSSTSAVYAPNRGVVTFYDGNTVLGTSQPLTITSAQDGYGLWTATFTTSALMVGTHTITASYSDVNYSLTSATQTVVVSSAIANNVWIGNSNATTSSFQPMGTPFLTTAETAGGTGVAIDGSGNVWALNPINNSLAEFNNTGGVVNAGYTGGGLSTPLNLAIDGAGMIWVTNTNNTLSVFANSGAPVVSTPYAVQGQSAAGSIAIDISGNVWLANSGNSSVTEVLGAATPVVTPLATGVTNNTTGAKP
jgi:hypothetical protein